MRLNFSGVDDHAIREGIRRIGKVVREQVALYGTLTGAEPAGAAPSRPGAEPAGAAPSRPGAAPAGPAPSRPDAAPAADAPVVPLRRRAGGQ
jgi:2-aminoadipate transaminase